MSRAGYPLNWFQWLIWMGAPVLLITALSTVLHWLWLKPEGYRVEHEPTAPFSHEDRLLMLIVGGMISLWMFGAWLNVSATMTALLGMAAMALVLKESDRILRQVDWDLVLFSGGTLSFAYIILESGTAAWIGGLLFGPIAGMTSTPWLVLLVLTALMLLRFPLSNGVSYSAVVFPIILSLGPIGGLEPLHVAFMALIAGALAFLPVQSTPSLMTYSSRRYGVSDTVMSGSLMFLASFLVIQFFALPFWLWLQG
jgi:DASS family divalent anion:Na+ symporter